MKTKILFAVCFSLFCIGLFSWTWPLSNSNDPDDADTFTSAFGPRDKYGTPGLQYDFHRGMDLQATLPENVYPAHSGNAYLADGNGGGNWIYIEDGSTVTYYMHLSDRFITHGQAVTPDTLIGKTGDSGTPGYPHLHFAYLESYTDYKHPLQVMPYTNDDPVGVEMVTTFEDNFSFKLTIDDTELDIDRIEMMLGWYDWSPDYSTDQYYTIDYSEEDNIPIGVSNSIVIESNNSTPPNTSWRMYVTPSSFNPGADQEIIFSFEESEVSYDLVMEELSLWIYDATGTGATLFTFDDFTSTFSEENIINNIPSRLISNYPNPFNPTTTISYSLADNIQNPQIEIYNPRGQKVKNFNLEETPGENSVVWDGRNENDKQVSSGVYFYRLVNEGKTVQSRKMLMLK